ncbi:hypothetical protein [Bifidobacterium sp. SO1]|uniref:hypothetical protein n=1 Tax=Bifidobacterium sp. SO1 TaxID=2809029 RepID=UPI001BDDC55A|nr:hypothetical protein [Bifidobacterium sp. SO1]MBT1162231.1 hypothetical protein [Bifidobacterium sp. SO1]
MRISTETKTWKTGDRTTCLTISGLTGETADAIAERLVDLIDNMADETFAKIEGYGRLRIEPGGFDRWIATIFPDSGSCPTKHRRDCGVILEKKQPRTELVRLVRIVMNRERLCRKALGA